MQKITPCLWFDNQAEEAVNFYLSAFGKSKIISSSRYDETAAKTSGQPAGSVMTMIFELNDMRFMALNGGPHFKFNPSVSFFVNFDPSRDQKAKESLDNLWDKLADGGKVLMALDSYPFSKRYGWIQDKYGLSWQLILSDPGGDERPVIVPSLLFVKSVCGLAEEATDYYLSLFKDSKRGITARYPAGMESDKEGTIMYTDLMIENLWLAAMDSAGEHNFAFNEAVSFVVNCDTQEEIDYYWDNLTSSGGQESMCGWLKDKYGISWQIVPSMLGKLMSGTDAAKSKRVMQTLMQMKKIVIETLKKA